jgi:predicted ATP-grasp superfamily ATP-dependent carboligase
MKNSGVFICSEAMKDLVSKEKQKVDWLTEHTLTQQQLKKLIVEKFARAKVYQEAVRKRETVLNHS